VRRTFSCLHSLKVEEDFILPALTQSRGGLYLVPQLAQGVHLLPLDALKTFSLSRLKTHESVEVFNYRWCLRSRKYDEDFKTLTGAANRRKTMEILKLLFRKHAA